MSYFVAVLIAIILFRPPPLLSERKNVVEIVVDVVGKHFSRYLFNIFNAVSATELSQAKCEEEAKILWKMCGDDTIPTCVNMKHGTIQHIAAAAET